VANKVEDACTRYCIPCKLGNNCELITSLGDAYARSENLDSIEKTVSADG
jgi:hypothetical protein